PGPGPSTATRVNHIVLGSTGSERYSPQPRGLPAMIHKKKFPPLSPELADSDHFISTFPLENRRAQCYRTGRHPYVAGRKANPQGGPVVRDDPLERRVGGEGFFVAGSTEGLGGALPQLLVSALRLPAPG